MSLSLWPMPVDWYDVTLATPAENLALDEVLLNDVERDPSRGILRTWEPASYFVVVGRSNSIATEVDAGRCRIDKVPILRRSSGGGAVVIGPGCLAYTLVLPLTRELRSGGVTSVTRTVMETIADGLSSFIPGISVCGTSDLVLNERKFSGNSQRWLSQAFLHHGTILYDFDLPMIGKLLKAPTRQPDYRSGRSHQDFITNVAAVRDKLLGSLVDAWNGQSADCPAETLRQARELAQSRYARDEWNLER